MDIWITERFSSLYFSYTTFTCQHVAISCTFLLDSLANDSKISFDISFDDAHSTHYGVTHRKTEKPLRLKYNR